MLHASARQDKNLVTFLEYGEFCEFVSTPMLSETK